MHSINDLSYLDIRVFLSVFKNRQAKIAAQHIGVSPVTVSRSLRTLKSFTQDPLFTRTGHGLVPTARACELADLLLKVDSAMLNVEDRFSKLDYESSDRCFVIYGHDEFLWAIQEVITNSISPLAPKLRFNINTINYQCGKEVVDGSIDFLVTYEGYMQSGLIFEKFSSPTSLYVLCRKDHPLTKLRNLTTNDLARYPLVQLDSFNELSCPILVDLCRQDNLEMTVDTYTISLAAACQMVMQTDRVCIVCNQFTRKFVASIPALACIDIPQGLVKRISNMRSQIRPIGNYLAYSNKPHSPLFIWVKEKLLEGLKKQWEAASK